MFFRLARIIRPFWRRSFKGLGLGLLVGILGLVTPLFVKVLFDDVYPSRNVGLMHVIVIAVFLFSVSSSVMGAIQGYYSQVVDAQLGNSLSLMFFNHLQHLRVEFFDRHRVGEIMSRFGDLGRSQ